MAKTSFGLKIKVSNGELENRSERNPKQIRNLEISNPSFIRINGDHRPNQSRQNQNYIQSRKNIAFQAELNRCEGEIKNQIQEKRQGDNKSDFFIPQKPKNPAERNCD